MSAGWPLISLAQVIKHRREFVQIDDVAIYKRCRVQLHAQGIVLRDTVPGVEVKTKEQQVCRTGEFLVAEIDAKVGGFGIVPDVLQDAIVSSHYFLFVVDDTKLDRRFLDFYIRTPDFRDQVKAQGSTNYAAIRPADVLAYTIPLPPLPEQQRIVARIAALAARIEEARGLRREAVAEALQLSKAGTRTVFQQAGQEHPVRPLKGLFQFRGDLVRPGDGTRGTLLFIGLQHIESDTGRHIGRDLIEAEMLDGRKFRFSPGEIVYGYLRPYLNKVWVAEYEGICSVDQYVLQPVLDLAETNYLAHYMRSPCFVEQANAQTNNLMLPRLRSGLLESITIPLPPLPEQRRIVAYLDVLQARVDALKALQAATAAELDALLPAVLDRAFKGEL